MMKWHVSEKDKNVPSQAEAGGNAFVEDGEELPNPATNLVREAIQNSLDKRVNLDEPVVVHFSVRDMDEEAVKPWLGLLMPHAASCWPKGLTKAQDRPRVLVVEDFNTQGLNGDSAVNTRRDAQLSNDFFYFWRAQNISPKGGQGGGSWGVGKTTYYLLSHIGTIIGLSVPTDPASVKSIMGRCHLTEHCVEGSATVYQHFGYGCDPEMIEGAALPLTSENQVQAFQNAWPLARKSEPGLSIVIPYLRVDLEAGDLVRAAIEEYPYPIASGDLRVVVSDEKGKITTIDTSTVDEIGNSCELSPRALKHLALSRILRASQEPVEIASQLPRDRPSTNVDLEQVDRARELLSEHGFVHFRVPMNITRTSDDGSEAQKLDFIDVILQESDDRNHHFCIRSGLWVKGEPGQGVSRARRMDTLLVLHAPTDNKLPSIAELMGRFEGASHLAWNATIDDDRRPTNYRDAQDVRAFVRRLPSELAQGIAMRAESEHFPLAEDWFSATSEGIGSGGPNSPTGGTGTKRKKVKLKGRTLVTAQLEDNDKSKVRFTLQGKAPIAELRIRLGYEQQDRARSSNLDKWSANDFGVQLAGRRSDGKLKVMPVHGYKSFAKNVNGNLIVCRDVVPSEFGLVIEGLDIDRGLQWDAEAWDENGQPMRLTGGES